MNIKTGESVVVLLDGRYREMRYRGTVINSDRVCLEFLEPDINLIHSFEPAQLTSISVVVVAEPK